MSRWTPEQEDAINSEGTNIIVSAGAGSGKTAVLTERVNRKLREGVHVNELLVLTFTNAAAKEMKDRIRRSIKKTPGLEKEAELIDGAYITTFDSFSLSIVKKYHTKLNITNKIKITDDVVIDIKKQELLDNIMDEKYKEQSESFLKLIDHFCLKDDKDLKKYILTALKKIELKYDKNEYLENYIDDYFKDENLDKIVNDYLNLIYKKKEEIRNNLLKLNSYFEGEFLEKMNLSYDKLMNAENYDEILKGLDSIVPVRVPPKSDEHGKVIKTVITDLTKELKELCVYESTSEMKEELISTKSDQEELIDIIKRLNKALSNYKRVNDIYNFNDIAHMAINVVKENDDIREELVNTFNEIMVDEYQDTSDTQEVFINLISNNNVYMVGDIKQSIYRFRNANPYIFKNKYDSYSKGINGKKIDLVKNFRSRDIVLNNINTLFDNLMDDEIGGANYQESHRMVFGNKTYIEEGKTDQDYDLDIITYSLENDKEISKEEKEIFIIGNDIKNKVENKWQVFDKDEKVLRNIDYSDFVILLDKSTNFDLYKKIFEYLGIPLTIMKDTSIRKDDDILIIKNLLKLIICIKNNNFDTSFKYSFTSISRSFLYKTDDDIIFEYFKDKSFKNSPLFKKCEELTKYIDIETPSEFFYKICDEFNYDEKLLTIKNIKQMNTRKEYFYNLIKDFSDAGNTIYDFVDYLDSIFDLDYDLKFSINEKSSSSCKIMTIHKSKGLEFPICYFAGFSSKFNLRDLNERIIFDNKYGLVLPKVEDSYKSTICKTLLKVNYKREEISERIRLLYVAVTRAKEKMIVVMPQVEEGFELDGVVPTYERDKYSSFLSIMKSLYPNLLEYVKPFEEDIFTKEYIENNKDKNIDNLKLLEDKLEVKELSFIEEYLEEAKFSKESMHIETKEEQELLDFGTNVHKALEQLNFKDPQIDKLDLKDNIKEKIKAFLSQDIIKENLNSKIYKEYEFLDEGENSLSHGIIDLMIETENNIIIIDYKLKNIDDEAYDKQLNGYRNVIKKKTNKVVDCYLYSVINENLRKVIEK